MLSPIRYFLKLESASGILLIAASVIALILANSPFAGSYKQILELPVAVQVGALEIAKPLLLWVNDGLMAVFFFLIGLELKREFLEGELSDIRKVALPALGAVGGMALPAAIYLLINRGDAVALSGWAIPAATDIAFALGILALLGKRVPNALKIFLVSLAIFDDIGAIVIIAFFYTAQLSFTALSVSVTCIVLLALLNWRGAMSVSLYVMIGIVMWVALLKSGIHATLAGIILAMFIPMTKDPERGRSPLHEMEHDLHCAVSFAILPLFAFVNAGVPLQGMTLDDLLGPVPVGIALGLLIGKQLGVFGLCYIGIKLGLAKLPTGVSWWSFYGVAILCGIGFTMSLFIGSLAFESYGPSYLDQSRIGILAGSFVSAVLGYLWLRRSLPRAPQQERDNSA